MKNLHKFSSMIGSKKIIKEELHYLIDSYVVEHHIATYRGDFLKENGKLPNNLEEKLEKFDYRNKEKYHNDYNNHLENIANNAGVKKLKNIGKVILTGSFCIIPTNVCYVLACDKTKFGTIVDNSFLSQTLYPGIILSLIVAVCLFFVSLIITHTK